MTDIWEKRAELDRLMKKVNRLRSEIRDHEFERERQRLSRLSAHPRRLLRAFAESLDHGHPDFDMLCYGRRTLRLETGLDDRQLSLALGRLKRLGFVELVRGLMDEDGRVCGSGYGVTKAGVAWWTDVEESLNEPR